MSNNSITTDPEVAASAAAAFFAVYARVPTAQELAAAVQSVGDSQGLVGANGPLAAQAQTVRDLRGIYQVLLGRADDADGLSAWAGAVAGGESLVDAADAFLGSAEFVAKHPLLTDQDFINLVFSGVFSRTATPSEAAGWLSAMGSGTLTRGAMVVDLVQSADGRGATGPLSRVIAAETAADLSAGAIAARVSQAEEGAPPTTDDLAKGLSSLQNGVSAMALANNLSQTVEGVQARQLRGIYQGLLNRAADAAGLSRWLAAVQAGMGLDQAAEGFLLSGEYLGNPGHRNLDNESFVKSLYQGFFAGQYDPVAGNAAIAGLDAGTLSRGQVGGANPVGRSGPGRHCRVEPPGCHGHRKGHGHGAGGGGEPGPAGGSGGNPGDLQPAPGVVFRQLSGGFPGHLGQPAQLAQFRSDPPGLCRNPG